MVQATCPNVLEQGTCSDASCQYTHNVYNCTPCTLVFGNQADFNKHLSTKNHLNKTRGETGTLVFCTVCQKYVSGMKNWAQHVSASTHVSKAASQGMSPDVQPEEPEVVPGHTLCAICNRYIPSRFWAKHPNQPQHKEREQFLRFNSAIEETEKDKNGVSVIGDFDFKIVEPVQAASGISIRGRVETAVPSSRISLVDIRLASAKGAKVFSPFTVSLDGSNRTLTTRSPLAFTVTMSVSHISRFEDRLELVFEDIRLRSMFMISRSLQVIVGSKEDHEQLKPTIPYVPRKRTERQPELDVVEGEAPPSTKAIPYVDQLPFADIPRGLRVSLATGSTKEVIARMRGMYLPRVLNGETYGKHFKHLIWAEEFQMDRDLEYYDITDAQLKRYNSYYYLEVPGLAEKRPSVLVGDRILVRRPSGAPGHWYAGGVHVVRREEVGLKFHRDFFAGPNERFLVRFKLNRYPLRRQHQALDSAFRQERVLFPTEEDLPLTATRANGGGAGTRTALRLYNSLIGTNPPQLQAVTSIAYREPGTMPFVIFGPPGTGKTVTLVESILQVLRLHPTSHILACAPSNSAADLIASRLAAHLDKDEMFRLYAPSRSKDDVPTAVLPYTHQNRDGHFSIPQDENVPSLGSLASRTPYRTSTLLRGSSSRPSSSFSRFSGPSRPPVSDGSGGSTPGSIARILRFRVIITTCVSAAILPGIGVPRGHFSHIFVDEAGQATEPEVMISIKGIADSSTRVVLGGDPKQLGPIVRSGVARALGLETSFVERLMGREVYDEVRGYGRSVVKLVKNFRSHPAILKFPNERFYGSDLQPCGDPKVINFYVNSPHLAPNPKAKNFPIVFHSVKGKDDREASSPSFFNIDEVTVVKQLVQKLRADRKLRISDNDIGIIAPYHAQVLKLRTALRAVADSVKVGSVEEFQGQERRVIIISTVRSSKEFVQYDLRHTLGFVANPRRFNVAITRAQALLLIVGDPSVLSLDPLWRAFLNYIHTNGGWSGPQPAWNTSAPVEAGAKYDEGVRNAARDDMNEFTRMIEAMTIGGVMAAEEDGAEDVNVDRPWNEVE